MSKERAAWNDDAATRSDFAIKQVDHIAYRCRDAAETTAFYTEILGLKLVRAIMKERVPSTQAYCPFIHLFFELADGSAIAFFELRDQPPAVPDPNTPDWVEHIAMELPDREALEAARRRLVAAGLDVVGTTDHGFCHSIYFFDPNGHRLELTVREEDPAEVEEARSRAYELLDRWSRKKQAS